MTIRANHTQAATLAALGLAVAALLAMGWILFGASGKSQRTQAMQQQSMHMLERLAGLRESLALAESGHRGFLLTGDAPFLQLREQALAQLWQHSTALQAEAAATPAQRLRSKRLAGLLVERVGMMRKSERLRTERSGVATGSSADALPEQVNAQIRKLVNEWGQEETRLLSDLLHARQRDQAATWHMLLYLGLVVTALMLPILWGILRQSSAAGRANAKLREIADSLPGTVYVFRRTRDGTDSFDFLSTNAGSIMGLGREQLMDDATSMRGAVLHEDLNHLEAEIERSAAALSPLEVDFRIRAPDGRIRWLRSSGIPDREAGGDVVWNGYWSDITQIKDNEQALRLAMQRLEDAQRVAGIGDWNCDLATGALTWSSQVYDMLERDPAAGPPDLEEGVAMFENGAAATADAFFKAQETGEPQDYEMTARLPSGGQAALHVIVVPNLDDTGTVVGMRGTIQDITARKALEEHLSQAKETADSANQAKSVFLSTMSHEIRTHLNGMLGILELISLTALNPDLRTALDGVRESGKSLQRIIDDILDFSKVEAGKLDIHPEPASIEDVVAGVHRIYAGSASTLGLEMRYQVDTLISPSVMVDALRLRQILSNFVSNAIKFTPKGRIELRARLLRRDGDRERLRFEVEDTGIGISAERQQHLFQPFEQGEASTAKRFGGTGLGLSISRRLAELMGGAVDMASAPGKGTTMSLDLTVAKADPVPVPHPASAQGIAMAPTTGGMEVPSTAQAVADGTLVLVVDDHPVNRMVLRRQLNTLGYAAEEVGSGAEALEQWSSGRFALIVSDCNMPEMSGYELSRRIRQAEEARGGPRTPIIACSANVIRGVRQECRDAGMDDYIAKPTELVPLAEIMKRWLPLPDRHDWPAASGQQEASTGPASSDEPLQGRALHAITKGDPDATRRVLEQFRRVNDADVARLLDAVERGDHAATTHLAHRVKGACGFIGATALASVCATLEQAGRDEDTGAIAALMRGFRSELERLNAYLDAPPRQ